MAKNTSILLGDYFEDFINEKISSGEYSSVSEVIRSALRLLEKEERQIEELRKALDEGEKSKTVEDFNPGEHLKNLRDRHL